MLTAVLNNCFIFSITNCMHYFIGFRNARGLPKYVKVCYLGVSGVQIDVKFIDKTRGGHEVYTKSTEFSTIILPVHGTFFPRKERSLQSIAERLYGELGFRLKCNLFALFYKK